MSNLRKAAEQARNALANARDYIYLLETGDVSWSEESQLQEIKAAIFALKKALAEPEQKSVTWKLVPVEPTHEMLKAMDECSTEEYDERLLAGHAASVYMAAVDVAPLYTAPIPRKPLTDEEIAGHWPTPKTPDYAIDFARAIEKAHSIGVNE